MKEEITESCIVISTCIENGFTFYQYSIEEVFFIGKTPISKTNINLLQTYDRGNTIAPKIYPHKFTSVKVEEKRDVIEAMNQDVQKMIDYYTNIKPSRLRTVYYPDDFKEIDSV